MDYATLATMSKSELQNTPCSCVSCSDCGGSGNVWFSFPGPDRGGRYLGNHRSDDLDEMEACANCQADGIVETCDRCQLIQEFEMDQDERRY